MRSFWLLRMSQQNSTLDLVVFIFNIYSFLAIFILPAKKHSLLLLLGGCGVWSRLFFFPPESCRKNLPLPWLKGVGGGDSPLPRYYSATLYRFKIAPKRPAGSSSSSSSSYSSSICFFPSLSLLSLLKTGL